MKAYIFGFQLNVPMYTTPFGPIVDGGIVPDEPLVTLSQKGRNNLFAKYDVMFGLSESEAFHLFPASLGKNVFFFQSSVYIKYYRIIFDRV